MPNVKEQKGGREINRGGTEYLFIFFFRATPAVSLTLVLTVDQSPSFGHVNREEILIYTQNLGTSLGVFVTGAGCTFFVK